MTEKEKLTLILGKILETKGLGEEYRKRLAVELAEVDAQDEYDYFLELFQNKTKYPENENNLLIPFLLGIVPDFDINKESAFDIGDWPDIDVDMLKPVRDYLKNEWAPKTFGADKVCNIGNYNTFGIKSSLINMARVFGKPRQEILDLTTVMGMKDAEGEVLTWDKAMEMFPLLKKYCEDNKDVGEAAKKLLHRNNGMGKHAGGIIISSVPIDNFVPLVKDKDNMPLSAWVEGLHGQDLGPMGLVKYDWLVLSNLMQIALAVKLIKDRHNLQSICALPGKHNWSDDSYLEDPKSLAMASRGDLKCIFQMDSMGMRQMIKSGGVNCFHDLVAYVSLYRPSALGLKMHERYIERKHGREKYTIHPILKPYLDKTYGVMVYQEQISQILNAVGEIPLKDCEMIRKAISKKKDAIFAKYKDPFIKNGKKNLQASEEEVLYLWNQVEEFSGYGFNKAHATGYSIISSRLLYLKSHYPLEFFAAIFGCETEEEKIKEYKVEATRNGIEIRPVDINKSGVKFKIIDNSIYFGLSNVKGIGEKAAQRIVDGQPYKDFTDFLTRFGTDLAVLKPLIGLKVFDEGTRIHMYKYCAWFKSTRKKYDDAEKRFETKQAKILEELKVYGLDFDESLDELKTRFSEEDFAEIEEIYKKHHKSIEDRAKKREVPVEPFNPELIEINEKLADIYSSQEESEKAFYGFLWTHPLEKSPDFDGGQTLESFRVDNVSVGPIEVMINSVAEKKSQKGNMYWLLGVEDANSETAFVQVWTDDWQRFKDDLQEKALVKIRVQAPFGNFPRYTLDSPPRHKRYLLPTSRDLDCRVCVMRRGDDA